MFRRFTRSKLSPFNFLFYKRTSHVLMNESVVSFYDGLHSEYLFEFICTNDYFGKHNYHLELPKIIEFLKNDEFDISAGEVDCISFYKGTEIFRIYKNATIEHSKNSNDLGCSIWIDVNTFNKLNVSGSLTDINKLSTNDKLIISKVLFGCFLIFSIICTFQFLSTNEI